MEPTPPSQDLILMLLAAGQSVERHLDQALSVIKGITFSEYQLLSALAGKPKATATRVDLAAAVAMTPSGVTRALKPLEKLGFVKTVKDDRDARRSLATLTADGSELVNDASGVVDDVLDDITSLDDLSATDRARLAGVLTELAG
ncbi:MAG: MarR family winged helix-turn-helix transcriptional regulator [Acidimicrobiales bacterium]